MGAAALTWAPYFSLYFLAYELLTTRGCGVPVGEQPPFAVALTCGLAAGIGASALTNPFDVVKTRMQSTGASQYKSTFDCFAQIVRNEGMMTFYAGAVARSMRVLPGQGIIFMSAESIYNMLERRFKPQKQ